MATKAADDITVVVIESFVGRVGSEDRYFRAGDLIRATDPAVKKWPDHFREVRYANEPVIEQATAAPGEKRGA